MAARARNCKGTTKQGKPCRVAPLKGSDYCSTHNPDVPSSMRFGSPEHARTYGPLGGRPRRPREIELIQEVAEEFRAQLRAVYAEGLSAERALVVGNGPSARLEREPDHAHRLRTAQEIQDRLHGKPRQAVEHTGADGGMMDHRVRLDLSGLSDEQLLALEAIQPVDADG